MHCSIGNKTKTIKVLLVTTTVAVLNLTTLGFVTQIGPNCVSLPKVAKVSMKWNHGCFLK